MNSYLLVMVSGQISLREIGQEVLPRQEHILPSLHGVAEPPQLQQEQRTGCTSFPRLTVLLKVVQKKTDLRLNFFSLYTGRMKQGDRGMHTF